MKELSIEEKAKAYDEAIKRAKDSFNYPSYPGFIRADVVFPELKENEDERILEIIKHCIESRYLHTSTIKGISQKECFAWLEKQGEQKPTDKVEPKFKVGDWVVQENIGVYKVIEVCESWYEVVDNKDKHYSIDFDKQYMCHLYTIKDAKDGDVLVCESGWTCIFKALDNHTNTFSSYCFMDSDKWFCNTGSECHTLDKEFMKAYNGDIKPATKEQRDTLMKAMADAGYTFDFEKKELKKIEQKPTESSKDDGFESGHAFDINQKF